MVRSPASRARCRQRTSTASPMIWRTSPASSTGRMAPWWRRASTWKRSASAGKRIDGTDGAMVTIRLLGPPAVERDGQPQRPPRGRKAWALLCYLLLAQRPPSRRHLADLLFADAADPLGALRWTLAEVRRVLGTPAFTGDPVDTTLSPEVTVDVRLLLSDAISGPPLLDLGGELLEGLQLGSNAEFESWLLVERHRIAATV